MNYGLNLIYNVMKQYYCNSASLIKILYWSYIFISCSVICAYILSEWQFFCFTASFVNFALFVRPFKIEVFSLR